jgi:hypothetical protein
LIKGEYKKDLLHCLIEDLDIDIIRLIKTSIKNVKDDKARNCVRNGREAIEK